MKLVKPNYSTLNTDLKREAVKLVNLISGKHEKCDLYTVGYLYRKELHQLHSFTRSTFRGHTDGHSELVGR